MTPLVPMVELIMMLLLITMMQQSPNIKIHPFDTPIKDSIILASDNGAVSQFFDKDKNIWIDIELYSGCIDKAIGGDLCKSSFCKNIPNPKVGKKVIYYTGALQEELSFFIADSCLVFPNKCTNVEYNITKDGKVDRETLLKNYPFFRYILKPNE